MPGKVKVRIVSGRNLPIMDRSNLTTDAYVEVKLGSTVYKTDVYRKSLNPVWNSEWFRFEMDDLELQDEPLQIRLMDHDTYSSNDAIGKVYLDLNPLLCNSSRGKDTSGKMISGWIPVYDTMHGIRGEVNLIVKVELFSDLNKFRQSSCGVRFFFTQSIPEGYIAHTMYGFVEELVVNDDPEYQWIDKIRTPRASNEARQTLFSKLSGIVQRRVGLKALELGGNSVIGYKQCFDLEGESGIVVRGIGTAAYLTKQYESQLSPTCGESVGMSREFAELQGYRSFTKNGRSLKKRGGPGRAPRLQRRSFRAPSSSNSMSGSLLLHQHNDGGTGRKKSHDDTCLLAHAANNFEVESLVEPGSGAVVKHGSFEAFKERSSSFREDSAMNLIKFNLKKSRTSSTQSVPHTTSSPAHKDILSSNVPDITQSHLAITTSEPSIEVGSNHYHEGTTICPSFTNVPSPLPTKYSKSSSPSFTPNSTFRSRSTSRLPHNLSPLFKPRHMECSSIVENDVENTHTTFHNTRRENDFVRFSFDDTNRSRSAVAACMTQCKAYSETINPAMSSQTIRNDQEVCRTMSRSVNELPTSAVILCNHQILGCISGGGELESAGSNLDSNIEEGEIDEDSTSDTSVRFLYSSGPSSMGSRLRGDTEIESDTSKDFTKASSGNEACSVDNDELSPVSEREGFLLLKKKRGSRRKDRYSKSSLMKRASANFAEKGYLFGGTEKIKEEVVKFFKRKKSSDDNESCGSSTKNACSSSKKSSKAKSSPYREAKFFFRRRRTASNKNNIPNPLSVSGKSKSSTHLFRSNSDSHSLGQTSLDSMPSVGSEPGFDPEDDDSSHDVSNLEVYLNEKITAVVTPKLQIPEVDEDDHAQQDSLVKETTTKSFSQQAASSSTNVLQVDKSKLIEIIKELGYSTEAPLKLYISSMDALLVYDPSDESSSGAGTLVADSGGASACSHSSALSPAIFHVGSECDSAELNNMCAGCSSSSQSCSSNNSKGSLATPSTNRSRFLCRQGTAKVVPTVSLLFESDTSEMTSFSTMSRLGTNDSFTTNTSELASSFPTICRLINRCSNSFRKSSCTSDNKCTCFPKTNINVSSRSSQAKTRKLCPIHAQNESNVSFKDCDNLNSVGDETEGIILSSAKSENSDEDIILVVTSTKSSGTKEDVENEEVHNDNLHDDTEHMGVTGCRSPIPEELLCDRSTPTQCNMNQNNTLTGGVSNFSVSTITNSIVQHAPTSAPANTTHLFNISQSGVAHSETMTLMNANASTTNSTNNSTCSTMTCGGTNTLNKLANSSEDAIARHDNGSSAVAILDESATKHSLVSSTPCPPHPSCDPQHHPPNGLNHRHGYKEIPSCLQSAKDHSTTESDYGAAGDTHAPDKNGVKVTQKLPISSAYHVSHQNVKNPGTGPIPPPYISHNHMNMTTTIITSSTGMPMVNCTAGGSGLHRRSSESDLSTPPKHSSMASHIRGFPSTGVKPGITAVDQYGLMEYPFITISQFPPGFLTHIGGTVTARSVKLLERISNLEEPESRDAWWNEIRMEIRAHCRAFGCTVVVGYEEHTTMCDDVCVLSASGTAAIATTTIGLKNVELLTVSTKQGTPNPVIPDAPCHGRGVEKDRGVLSKLDSVISTAANNGALKHVLVTPSSKLTHDSDHDPNCSMLHIPSNPAAGLPFAVKMSRCHVCRSILVTSSFCYLDYEPSCCRRSDKLSKYEPYYRKCRVPDVLIVTVDIPPGLHITGKGTLIQAQVFRPKKDCKGEISAKEVSDSMPFLEYELHRRLINKLKVKGMNAIFGLKVQICLGDKLMVAVATGTAIYVTALPAPGVPIITAGNMKTDAQKVLQYQKVVQDAYDRNRLHYDLKTVSTPTNGRQSGSSGEESDEDENAEIQSSNKDTYILEVDDAEDIDIISMLIDPHPTTGFLMNNIDYLHGYEELHVSSQQMFTQVWRCRIPTLSLRQFTAYFERLIRSVSFKLRKMMPCVLSKLSFRVELPEPDEMQISIIGLALSMADQSKPCVDRANSVRTGSILSVAKEDSELLFPLEDDNTNQNQGTYHPIHVSMTKSGELPSTSSESVIKDLQRGTPPPMGILVPAVGQTSNTSVTVPPRLYSQQPCTISSSPHSHCSSHLSGNGCGHANGSGTALPPVAPQLSKYVSGDSGNLASSSSSILPGHGMNYSFRGVTHNQPFSLSRGGSKVIPKSALQYSSKPKFVIEITPLPYIPGARIEKYLGNLNFFFIRETTSIRENGGLSGFVHNFVAEVLAIVRAHVAALGGNAMVSYFMTELALLHNPHKNQGQCLINVGGDVVLVVHPSPIPEEAQMGS